MLNIDNKRTFIIANWKMNPVDFVDAENLLRTVKSKIKKSDRVKIVICPPAVYISNMKKTPSIDFGAQNVFWKDKGAYTGEISAKMAKNLGASYAIIGHSERRIHLMETDKMVNLKILSAISNNLKPILCIGETLEEKRTGKGKNIVISQVKKALFNIPKSKLSNQNLLIAYEPIWAIGTGNTPMFGPVINVKILIRKIISELYDKKTAENLPILYGGSVNSQNAFDFVNKSEVNGLLVGGASLDGNEFARIVNLFT